MSAFLLGVVLLAGLFLVVCAPSFFAIHRWWFGGGKLLSDRLRDLPAPPPPKPR